MTPTTRAGSEQNVGGHSAQFRHEFHGHAVVAIYNVVLLLTWPALEALVSERETQAGVQEMVGRTDPQQPRGKRPVIRQPLGHRATQAA